MRALIAIGGELRDHSWIQTALRDSTVDLILAADSGARHLINLGLIPHFLIGDMDSIDSKSQDFLADYDIQEIKLPVDKDWSDTEFAINKAIEMGVDDIILLGSFAVDRPDHLLANQMMLSYFKTSYPSLRIQLSDGLTVVEAITGPSVQEFNFNGLPDRPYIVSLVPISDIVEAVSYDGLIYPLKDVTLYRGMSRSISNRPIDKAGGFTISLMQGTALLILTPDE